MQVGVVALILATTFVTFSDGTQTTSPLYSLSELQDFMRRWILYQRNLQALGLVSEQDRILFEAYLRRIEPYMEIVEQKKRSAMPRVNA